VTEWVTKHTPPGERPPGLLFKASGAAEGRELRLRGGQAKVIVFALWKLFDLNNPLCKEILESRTVDEKLVSAFCSFVKWNEIVNRRGVSKADERLVKAWLPLHAEVFDCHPYDHMPKHFAEDIREHGPMPGYQLYQLESYNGVSKAAWQAKKFTGVRTSLRKAMLKALLLLMLWSWKDGSIDDAGLGMYELALEFEQDDAEEDNEE